MKWRKLMRARYAFGAFRVVKRRNCECCSPEWTVILPDGEATEGFRLLGDARHDVERRAAALSTEANPKGQQNA